MLALQKLGQAERLSYIGKSQRFADGTLTLPSPTRKKRVGEDTVWLAMERFLDRAASRRTGVQRADLWVKLRAKAGVQPQMEGGNAGFPSLGPGFRRNDERTENITADKIDNLVARLIAPTPS